MGVSSIAIHRVTKIQIEKWEHLKGTDSALKHIRITSIDDEVESELTISLFGSLDKIKKDKTK